MDYGAQLLYVGKKGTFQHSSFLAGEATVSAWRFVVENAVLRAVWPWSMLSCKFLIFGIVDFIIKKITVFSVLSVLLREHNKFVKNCVPKASENKWDILKSTLFLFGFQAMGFMYGVCRT